MRRVRGSSRRLFECGGMAGGPVQEDTGRPGGPVQNISDVGGGASLPAQELTHWSLYNIITHKRLSPCHIFSGSLDADSIYMALNKTCPRFHFHTGNNETPITFSSITVYNAFWVEFKQAYDTHFPKSLGKAIAISTKSAIF